MKGTFNPKAVFLKRFGASLLDSPPFGWLIFGFFLAANLSLSYFSFSIENRLWIFFFGLLIPFILSLGISPLTRAADSRSRVELFPVFPGLILILLGITAVYLRCTQLTALSRWPLEDEAMNGHYAIGFAEKGEWQLTYEFSGMPPLYIWGLGVCFKLFGISLETLWLFPAVLSCLSVFFVFSGARKFFSESISVLFSGLMAFSFWPLYAGRFSVQGGLLVFWECLAFYLLGLFWKSRGENSRGRLSLVLGLCAGIGFYTFTSWAIVAFLLTLFMFFITAFQDRKQWKLFLFFFIPELFLFLILAAATLSQRGGHFQYVLQNPIGISLAGLNDTLSIFWGSPLKPNLFAYRPFWGGVPQSPHGGFVFLGYRKPFQTRIGPVETDFPVFYSDPPGFFDRRTGFPPGHSGYALSFPDRGLWALLPRRFPAGAAPPVIFGNSSFGFPGAGCPPSFYRLSFSLGQAF